MKSIDKKGLNKDFDVFLREQGLAGIQHAFIEGVNKLVKCFEDTRAVLESDKDPEFNQ